MPQDRWPELCRLYSVDDGLPTRKAGSWTEEKLYFWNRYIDITTRAMVGHPKWQAGLTYVDLFAGPGICRIEDSTRRFPGSTLIAAHAPKPFNKIISVEMATDLADALRTRVAQSPAADRATVITGDCNLVADDIANLIPTRSLTLAFIDPENLNVDFDTVKKISAAGQVDLLILFADRMDLVRNIERYFKDKPSVLDRMMGPQSLWRTKWEQLSNWAPENICRLFADEYQQQLKHQLGYVAFGEKVMRSNRGPLYRLIFASKNVRGIEFWDKIAGKDRSGQSEMF